MAAEADLLNGRGYVGEGWLGAHMGAILAKGSQLEGPW